MNRILLGAALFALVDASVSAAQTPSTATPSNDCTYAACALRIEPGLSGPRLVRGVQGEAFRLGGSQARALELFGRSDSATVYATPYVRTARQQDVASLLGLAGFVTLAFRTHLWRRPLGTGDVVIAGATSGLVIANLPLGIRAQRQLSRAVWWHNSTLPR